MLDNHLELAKIGVRVLGVSLVMALVMAVRSCSQNMDQRSIDECHAFYQLSRHRNDSLLTSLRAVNIGQGSAPVYCASVMGADIRNTKKEH